MMLDWTQITADGGWQKRRKHATVVYKGSIYIIGGFFSGGGLAINLNDVWRSDDGRIWECVCGSAPWPGRDGHTAVVFHDYIYVFGGTCDAYSCFNDVWRSQDGEKWEEVSKSAPWPERWQHAAVVHHDAMYILGGWGMVMFDDVWKSFDGINWEKICESGPWSKRMFHVSVVFQDHIYIIGGFDGRSYLNDVWKSPDGITWTQVCENGQVEWAPRRGFSAVVYEDKIYVVGGDTGVGVATDVWASKDGHLWELVWSDKPCCSRIGHSVVVHKGSMLVLGGVDGTGEYLSDVYQSIEAAHYEDDDIDRERTASSLYDVEDLYTLIGEDTCDYTSAKSEYAETTASSSLFTSSDIRAHSSSVCSMSSIILRATQLRQLRQRLHEIWSSNLSILENLEQILGPLGPRLDVEDSKALLDNNNHNNAAASSSSSVLVNNDDDDIHGRRGRKKEEEEEVNIPLSEERNSQIKADEGGLHAFPLDYQCLQEKFASLQQLQINIRKAAVEGNADEVHGYVRQRKTLAEQCLKLVNQVSKYMDEMAESQTSRIKDLDTLASSLTHRLGGAASLSEPGGHGGGPSSIAACPGLEPIDESDNHTAHNDSLVNVAVVIRKALMRLRSRSPSSLLSEKHSHARRGTPAMGDYNPARTDHILQNLEAALQEKSVLAHELSHWLSKPLSSGGSSVVTGGGNQQSVVSPQLATRDLELDISRRSSSFDDKKPMLPARASSCPSGQQDKLSPPLPIRPPTGARSKDGSSSSSHVIPPLLRRGASSTASISSSYSKTDDKMMSGLGGGGGWDIVSLARKWDEIDLIYRLQNQAHLAINRELQYMPSELDHANMMGRVLIHQALLRTTVEVTNAQAQKVELRGLREAMDGWQERLTAWSNDDAKDYDDDGGHRIISHRCQCIKREEKELADLILNLEDEQIDCRSNLDKRMRRHPAAQQEINRLMTSLNEAGKAVQSLRKRRRKLLSEAAGFVRNIAPELLLDLPEILNPFVAGQQQGGGANKLPRRMLEEYDDVKPWDNAEETAGRHVLLRAHYDDEDVVLKGYALHNERQRAALEREVMILCSLHHDAIIQVRALVEDSSQAHSHAVPMLYLEFPYCSGGNLMQWLSSHIEKRSNLWELQSLARQLLCAIMYLHDRGIIHKDIKPGNLLIHGDGRLLLADFDLSRETGGVGATVTTVNGGGTPGFIAPEVQRGEKATMASDMYSVGVVLFHMHFPHHPMLPVAGAIQIPEEADKDSEVRDLLMALLDESPERRPTASNALLHPYFRQTYVDRLVTGGELVEQNKKLEAVRALLYKSKVEQDKQDVIKIEADRSSSSSSKGGNRGGGQSLVSLLLDEYVGEMVSNPAALAKPLKVIFTGEAGVDQGGLLTELYTLVFDAIVGEENALFETAVGQTIVGSATGGAHTSPSFSLYLPKAGSDVANDAIKMRRLRAFGVLMVKCFYDGRRMGAHFAPSLFKFICGVDVNLQDLRQFDPQAGASLRWILSGTGIKELGLEFDDIDDDDQAAVAAVVGDGEKKKKKRLVTDQNKSEFARLKVQSSLVDSRRKQLEAVRDGFWWAIDVLFQNGAAFLKLLSHADWRVLLCGQENVNAAQVLAVLRFKDFTTRELQHGVPCWIKETIQSFSQDDLRRFLMFVTGSPSLPVAAVGNVEIVVRGLIRSNALPVAHTCFNELDVPSYVDAATLNYKLKLAMYESASFDKV